MFPGAFLLPLLFGMFFVFLPLPLPSAVLLLGLRRSLSGSCSWQLWKVQAERISTHQSSAEELPTNQSSADELSTNQSSADEQLFTRLSIISPEALKIVGVLTNHSRLQPFQCNYATFKSINDFFYFDVC